MDKPVVNVKQKHKKSIMIRFLEWIVRGNKRAAEKGSLCKS